MKIRTVYCYLGLWSVKIRTMSGEKGLNYLTRADNSPTPYPGNRVLGVVSRVPCAMSLSCPGFFRESAGHIQIATTCYFLIAVLRTTCQPQNSLSHNGRRKCDIARCEMVYVHKYTESDKCRRQVCSLIIG